MPYIGGHNKSKQVASKPPVDAIMNLVPVPIHEPIPKLPKELDPHAFGIGNRPLHKQIHQRIIIGLKTNKTLSDLIAKSNELIIHHLFKSFAEVKTNVLVGQLWD